VRNGHPLEDARTACGLFDFRGSAGDQELQTEKGAVANDSASLGPDVTKHDRLTAVTYPEQRARIHGEDAARVPHGLSRNPLTFEVTRVSRNT
jgi:hypothetical protein